MILEYREKRCFPPRFAVLAERENRPIFQLTKKLAESDLKRLKEVWEASGHKVPSKSELDSAEASLTRAIASESSAKAQASQAKATLEANRTDLGKMVITSPIDGIVLDRDIEPGQTVAASFQAPVLLTLAEDLTKMELSVDVDEADVGLVKDGQDAIFTVDAYPDQAFTANILHVKYGSDTTEGVVTYETLLSVDNKNLLLRPGMTATAEIIVKRINNELVIPNSALRFEPPDLEKEPEAGGFRFGPPMSQSNSTDRPKEQEGPLKKVWVLKNGKPEPLTITTGHTDGEMTQVTGGIEPGVEVITGIAEK